MKISKLKIENFRGIKSAELLFPDHVVLIGDNNTGKSTIFEAIDLALGPDRLNRHTVIDEHDFYNGEYLSNDDTIPAPKILIEATITDLSAEQQRHFKDYIEWWCKDAKSIHISPPPSSVDTDTKEAALRISFIGEYDPEEDDFVGKTFYSRSIKENDTPAPFYKKDKQRCGFLYLRSLRTGSRALSLERGSLLDIILRIKEIRPQMWEKTIEEIRKFNVASDPSIGISGVLESIEAAIKKYVPKEWGVTPHLKVSNLTREHLRKVVTAFIATGDGNHAAPFYHQGTGTLNILVLAMLSQIAQDKQNVIFAMEEPETAIPPYTQKRIIQEIRKLSTQTFFTSHSPYVLEEFSIDETIALSRDSKGFLRQLNMQLPDNIKPKMYRQGFRTRFCEGLLSRRVLIAEGVTEASAMPIAARRLSELKPDDYTSFEALGICTIDAGGEKNIPAFSSFYNDLGKRVFAICDKQKHSDENKEKIEKTAEKLFMHDQHGFEQLVLKGTTKAAIDRFIDELELPSHLKRNFPDPKTDSINALMEYFKWSKGNLGISDFLAQCEEVEVPEWIRNTCKTIKSLSENIPQKVVTITPAETEVVINEDSLV
ncbi:ATP-dependent endonuclease (plasmid) [Candidatus Megaera polyxenophila]|nr:ATP-dependent endonuclease [Candidatus Megaera polyxenophila]